MTTIYFATGNPAKIADFAPVFEQAELNLVQISHLVEIDENAKSLLGNAHLKAIANSIQHRNTFVMGNDGGVQIPFLGNWDQLLTKRLSGRDMSGEFTERQRAETLLEMMLDAKTDEYRKILWGEAFAIAYNGEIIFEHEHAGSSGVLARELPPNFQQDGYWLGWLWYDPRFNKIYMDMTKEEKFHSSDKKQTLLGRLKDFDFTKYKPETEIKKL